MTITKIGDRIQAMWVFFFFFTVSETAAKEASTEKERFVSRRHSKEEHSSPRTYLAGAKVLRQV